MFNASTMAIQWDAFEAVPEARRSAAGCAINVNCSGHVSLNSRLMTELKAREVPLKLGFFWKKQDRDMLLLRPTEHPNYTFPASGSKKDLDFSRALVAAGISLPARYTVAWNEDAGAWVGVLSGPRGGDPLEASIKASRAICGRARQ